jgi:hypothetical protein
MKSINRMTRKPKSWDFNIAVPPTTDASDILTKPLGVIHFDKAHVKSEAQPFGLWIR